MNDGFSCNNTQINYLPSYTASGHAGIYTGTVPAIHGITGNSWWDNNKQEYVYCTEDDTAKTVGSSTDAGHMSPVNLLTTTIGDEIKLATNFRNKTIGIALKDRGGIIAAGRSADAAYWYEAESGQWITSSYYMQEIPAWVKKFNSPARVDSLYKLDWHLLYPAETYVQSIFDRKGFDVRTFGSSERKFPYGLKRNVGKDYSILSATPHGNTLTTEFAKAAILNEQMGADSITDLLAVSYSSTDYIGHAYGPNSLEIEDAFLRLDKELGQFFDFLDKQVGKGAWVVFLTADHGMAHVPGFMKVNKMSAGLVDDKVLTNQLNEALKQQFGVENLTKGISNAQVILNVDLIKKTKKLGQSDVAEFVITWLESQEGISRAIRLVDASRSAIPDHLATQIKNGYFPLRSGHIQILYKSGYIEGFPNGGSTHGSGYAYDTHIPLLWYGWKIKHGQSARNMTMSDIAPTLAALLNIQEPSGSVGNVIYELY
jgi:predicted AlkP superfamily pyrophosphatase or phosphodiesterase